MFCECEYEYTANFWDPWITWLTHLHSALSLMHVFHISSIFLFIFWHTVSLDEGCICYLDGNDPDVLE